MAARHTTNCIFKSPFGSKTQRMNRPGHSARWILIAAAVLLSAPTAPTRADVYVIVNSTTSIRPDDIKLIYTGDVTLARAITIIPSNNRAAQSEFLSRVMGLNANRYEALWVMKCFRDGLNWPVNKTDDLEVIAFVQSTAGAIGYVLSAPPPGVLILRKF